jgi:hypothetical protein
VSCTNEGTMLTLHYAPTHDAGRQDSNLRFCRAMAVRWATTLLLHRSDHSDAINIVEVKRIVNAELRQITRRWADSLYRSVHKQLRLSQRP